eukprot:TRINITY_DN81_c0_g1_i2.p2 TRINITY_DN81_c0_g1~~TRINITY_DN81_c0_g1_i2.p2  ORF type:complete len:55 (+),score=10.88 TRINITY_DN81_c0_g1_i2:349-513(+)
MQPKFGGKLLLKLNIGTRPIANKYREGKMKSTLKKRKKYRLRLCVDTTALAFIG